MSENKNHPATLDVKPRICVLSENADNCEQFVQLYWSSDSEQSLCLFQVLDITPIKCWRKNTQGNIEIFISAEESVEFELRDSDNNSIVLAKTKFKIMRDQKKYRRSRRNPWSFF